MKLPECFIREYTGAIKAFCEGRSFTVGTVDKKSLKHGKLFFAVYPYSENTHGCFMESFYYNINTEPELRQNGVRVVELGDFSVSSPEKLKGLHVDSQGYVNDEWAIAIGDSEPEEVIYRGPSYQHFTVNVDAYAEIDFNSFKVFLLHRQDYGALSEAEWLSRAASARRKTADEVKASMSAQCAANDAMTKEFTDGFYANSIEISLLY